MEQTIPEAGSECSLGCQNAYRMGWIDYPLRKFGGLSPSPQLLVAPVDGEQCAREAVDGLNKLLPSTDGWVDYGHLQIRFGYLPASRFDTAKQLEIELSMEDLPQIEPSTFDECVQKQIAEVAPRAVVWISGMLKRKAERSGTATGTTESKATTTVDPPRDAAAETVGTFCRDGDGWLLGFGEERGHVQNFKGFPMVHALLSSPKESITISVLGCQQLDSSVKQPVMDNKYKTNVRRELTEQDIEIERAETRGDATAADVLRRERQEIADRFATDSGLRGKSKAFGDGVEKLRNRVSKHISSVSVRLEQCDPPLPKLAMHLTRSIVPQAGSYIYQPEQHVTWKLG